jgi:hypothetical protein
MMSTAATGFCRKRSGGTDRRSLLTMVTAGIGTLLSLPAQAHSAHGASDAGSHSFPNLKEAGAERRVLEIRHTRGSYRVVTADEKAVDFAETDLGFKVDSSATGPRSGAPVILPAGQVGDRALVFFAAPEEIGGSIKHG